MPPGVSQPLCCDSQSQTELGRSNFTCTVRSRFTPREVRNTMLFISACKCLWQQFYILTPSNTQQQQRSATLECDGFKSCCYYYYYAILIVSVSPPVLCWTLWAQSLLPVGHNCTINYNTILLTKSRPNIQKTKIKIYDAIERHTLKL